MRLGERRHRPDLDAQPGVMSLRPSLFGTGKPPDVTQEKFRETMARAEEIGPNIFPTAKQVAGGFFLFGRDVDGGECARAVQDRLAAQAVLVRAFDDIASVRFGLPADADWQRLEVALASL